MKIWTYTHPRVVAKNQHHPGPKQYVGRPSRYGNEFTIEACTDPFPRYTVILLHARSLEESPLLCAQFSDELKGKVLECWCTPRPCHAVTLARLADGEWITDIVRELERAGQAGLKLC